MTRMSYPFPLPRYLKLRAWSRGPWVPARLFKRIATDPLTGELLDRSPSPVAEVMGQDWDWDEVITYGREITEEEWKWLTALTPLMPELTRPPNGNRNRYSRRSSQSWVRSAS